jgi:nucleolar MIF4G domain-containing protein 1
MAKKQSELSRKQLRKQARESKKRKPLRKSPDDTLPLKRSSSDNIRQREKAQSRHDGPPKVKQSAQLRTVSSVNSADSMIDAEDREIERLNKLLGISAKDKRKALHKLNDEYAKFEGFGGGFADFLDDLDRVGKREPEHWNGNDSGTDEDAVEEEHMGLPQILDDDEQEPDDIELVEGVDVDEYDEEDEENEDIVNSGEEEEEVEDEDDSVDDDDNEEENGEEEEEEEQDDDKNRVSTSETYRPVAGEDIYGRPLGNNLDVTAKKYVPPAKRARMETALAEATEDAKEVRREVNGLMNRLSDQSKDATVRALKGVFEKNSTSITNNVLKDCIMSTCANPTQTMTFLIPTYASVICALHFVVGLDVGAHMAEHLAITLHGALGAAATAVDGHSLIGDKLPHNCLLLLIYMYNFRILSHQLIFDIMDVLIGNIQGAMDRPLSEMDAELLVLIFEQCGSQLRSDDPVKLRVAFDAITVKARLTNSSRTQFMMDSLTDLKNNKSRRSRLEHEADVKKLRRWLGSMKTVLGSKSSGDSCLRVTLSDLLNADTRGRWWKAGASWAGNQSGGETLSEGSRVQHNTVVNLREDEEQKLLKIAARMKLNTSTRKSIFLVIMSSRDVNDAFERLARMELKGKQDRDIVRVITECCGREKSYNAFYSELANLLCSHNRQFKTTLQFSFWDTFKAFGDEELTDRRATNLARMMAHLVCSFQLPLSVIKPIDMSQQLSESATLFLATFFMAIFASDVPEDSFQSIFDRVATTKDFAAVRDAVILFLRQYYTGAPKGIETDKAVSMDRRRKLALATMEKMTVLDYRGSEDD